MRQAGIASRVDTVLRAAGAAPLAVELSAVLLEDGDQECIGLTLRRKPTAEAATGHLLEQFAAAVDQLTAQLGSMALPELMQQANRLAERHLLGARMQLVEGHLDTAAELLAMTRESLRARLQWHGLAIDGTDLPGAARSSSAQLLKWGCPARRSAPLT